MKGASYTGKFILYTDTDRYPRLTYKYGAILHRNEKGFIVDYGPRFTNSRMVKSSLSSRVVSLKTVMG